MRNYTPVDVHGLRVTLSLKFSDFRIFAHFSACINYTSNMQAWLNA